MEYIKSTKIKKRIKTRFKSNNVVNMRHPNQHHLLMFLIITLVIKSPFIYCHEDESSDDGLQHVAKDLMGVKQWHDLYSQFNSIEQANDEPADWRSNELYSLCNSKNIDNHCSSAINSQISINNHNDCSIQNQKQFIITNQHNQFDQSTLKSLTSLLNQTTMTTTPIAMTNSNNIILNETEHLNSLNALISNENMANQNGTSLSEVDKVETNQHSSDEQLNDYSSLLNNSNNCMNSDLIDLDNISVKSETLSESTIDQNTTMTIGQDRNQFDTLAKLLTSNKGLNGLLDQMVNQMNTTAEQPLDLSLGSRKEFDFTDLGVLSSIYANSDIVGKIKNSRTRLDVTKKRSYTEEELGRALYDIQSGKLGTRRAAALYKIPRSTLRNKVHKMNSGDKKVKPQLISTVDDLLMNDLDKDDLKSASDHSPANDSLRELLKKNISLKSNDTLNSVNNLASTSTNLENVQTNVQTNLEIQQLLNLSQSLNNINNLNGFNNFSNLDNLTDLNNLNNDLMMNSLNNNLVNHLNNNNFLDSNLLNNDNSNNINSNLLNNTFAFQILNPQINTNLLDLVKLMNLIKSTPKLINDINQSRLDTPTDNLNESINSVLSGNSGRSSVLKINDQFNNHPNDEDTRSTLDDRLKLRLPINTIESNNNNDGHHTDESNLSSIALDEQIKKNYEFDSIRQKSTNLNESMNSTSSLNNNILFSTLNLMNNCNSFNQFGLVNLTNGLNNLNNFNNLNTLNTINNFQLNLQSMNDQTNSTLPINNSGTHFQSSISNASTNDVDPNRKRPKRGRYRNYNKSDLDQAVKAVQQGEMSVHRAGTLFSIPHSTLEYKVKERHLLRPSKRLKKQQQQEAAAQAINSHYTSTTTTTSINELNNKTSYSDNEMSKTGKLKNALIGKPQEEQKFNNSMVDMQLIQKSLLQSASNSITNLHQQQQNKLVASDLMKKLQENLKDDYQNRQQFN